jgi:hypothetical protein
MRAVDEIWTGTFPLIVIWEHQRTIVVLFDSNAPAATIIGNAFGHIHDEALNRAREIIKQFADYRLIIALHHHVTFPSYQLGLVRTAQLRGLVIDNADALLGIVPTDRDVTILHGHVHMEYYRQRDRLHVVSARSTTIGDERTGTAPGARLLSFAVQNTSIWPVDAKLLMPELGG